jgi:hypothetical protein
VCVSVARQRLGKNPPVVARQRLGRNVTAVTNTHATIEEFLDASFSVLPVCRIKESRRLVLPRTSCNLNEFNLLAFTVMGFNFDWFKSWGLHCKRFFGMMLKL